MGQGLIYFSLMRSSNLAKAYTESMALVQAFVSGERPVEPVAVQNAAASVVSSVSKTRSQNGHPQGDPPCWGILQGTRVWGIPQGTSVSTIVIDLCVSDGGWTSPAPRGDHCDQPARAQAALRCGSSRALPPRVGCEYFSCLGQVVSREQTVSACGLQSIMSCLRGTGPGHNARLLAAVMAVTVDDVRRVLQTYLARLFDPAAANMCITTNSAKVDEVVAGFQALGWALDRLTVDEAVAVDEAAAVPHP